MISVESAAGSSRRPSQPNLSFQIGRIQMGHLHGADYARFYTITRSLI